MEKKTSPDASLYYTIPEEYEGLAYPRIKMGKYIIVTYLFPDEKRAHAWKFFRDANVVYLDGSKIGLEQKDESVFKQGYLDEEMGIEPPKEEEKRKYRTKFGEFLFKSWNWVDRADMDRFLIICYDEIKDREKASLEYFGDKKVNVCDGIDHNFIRVDWDKYDFDD